MRKGLLFLLLPLLAVLFSINCRGEALCPQYHTPVIDKVGAGKQSIDYLSKSLLTDNCEQNKAHLKPVIRIKAWDKPFTLGLSHDFVLSFNVHYATPQHVADYLCHTDNALQRVLQLRGPPKQVA